jgi:hypothetical protein
MAGRLLLERPLLDPAWLCFHKLTAQDLFKGRHFEQEIITLCVRWYITFKLSFRDLVQMMAERGITLSHTTILRVQEYVPEFEKRWNHYKLKPPESYRAAYRSILQIPEQRDRARSPATKATGPTDARVQTIRDGCRDDSGH